MHHRPHRHRIGHRVDAEVTGRHVAHQRQALVDGFLTEVAHIEHHAVAPARRHHIAFFLFMPERLADAVARPEFHGLQHRLADRRLRSHAVVLQETTAVFIDQDAAFAAAGLGQQRAGVRQAGRVVLHELHVFQWHAGAVGQRHAVAGLDRAVGGEREHAPSTAAGDNHRIGAEKFHLTAAHLDRRETPATAVFDHQVGDVILVKALDRRELQRSLEQRVQDMETGLVGGEPGALLFHAAERPHRHRAVGFAAPRTAPVFELQQLLGCFADEIIHRILIRQPVAATDRIVEVMIQTVIGFDHPRRATLGRAGVAAHRVNLGHQGNFQRGSRFSKRNGCTQACATSPQNGNICFYCFHQVRSRVCGGLKPGPPNDNGQVKRCRTPCV